MKRRMIVGLLAVLVVSLGTAGAVGAAAGGLLWEYRFNFPGYDSIYIGAAAASTPTFIVCGTAYNSSSDSGDQGFIMAIDVVTGLLKWQKTLSTGANRNTFTSLSVVANTVLAEGYSASYTYNSNNNTYTYTLNQSTLRAYNATNGTLLWEVDKDANAPVTGGPGNIVTANNRVFVVRQESGLYETGTGDCIVQAYQVSTSLAPVTSFLLQQ